MKALGYLMSTLLLGIGLAASALAQYTGPIDKVSTKMPVEEPFRGHYFDVTKPGTGMNVDFGTVPNNGAPYPFVFITYYSYGADGSQKWYAIAGKYVANAELTRARSGVIGSLTDITIYSTTGGEPVTGPYHPSTPVIENLPVSLTWTAPRRAALTIGGNTWNMTAAGFAGGDDSLLPGRWGLSMHVALPQDDEVQTAAEHFTVDLAPAPFDASKVTVAPNAAQGVALPRATAKWFIATCVTKTGVPKKCDYYAKRLIGETYSPPLPGGSVAPTLGVWLDPPSGRGGVDMLINVTSSGATIGPENWHFDLYINSPDHMQAHGIHQWTKDTATYNPNRHLDSTLFFEKVPSYMVDWYIPQ